MMLLANQMDRLVWNPVNKDHSATKRMPRYLPDENEQKDFGYILKFHNLKM
jgi:hypothetical protein